MHETSGGGWWVSILYPAVPYILAQIQELEIAIDWEGARSSGKASIRDDGHVISALRLCSLLCADGKYFRNLQGSV